MGECFSVRAAQAKIGEPATQGWTGDYYAIAVHDLRPPFRWNLANRLKGLAFIKRDKKKDLKPSRVLVLPRANGLATFVYLFPRSVEITKKDAAYFLSPEDQKAWRVSQS